MNDHLQARPLYDRRKNRLTDWIGLGGPQSRSECCGAVYCSSI